MKTFQFCIDRGVRRFEKAAILLARPATTIALPFESDTARGYRNLLIPQLAGLRAVTIHVAPSIITDRSPGRSAKAARTAAEARSRMSSG
ncbi:hypothetical protein FBZ93_103434 [Bradyrhizobium macuxiense]|uniref:Uncharacterized protein n=1 Tax=Bradyrhizobium macuxiense TaxID=1755647 RepID=A0A560MCS2_9BRAD|nr:hypothetical protein FBZ93_103434 [Bradyrhizobium macuxiense]